LSLPAYYKGLQRELKDMEKQIEEINDLPTAERCFENLAVLWSAFKKTIPNLEKEVEK